MVISKQVQPEIKTTDLRSFVDRIPRLAS